MRVTVRKMMNTATHAVSADLPIRDAIDVLIDEGVTGIPVLGAAGKVTRKDVLRALRDLLPK